MCEGEKGGALNQSCGFNVTTSLRPSAFPLAYKSLFLLCLGRLSHLQIGKRAPTKKKTKKNPGIHFSTSPHIFNTSRAANVIKNCWKNVPAIILYQTNRFCN